MRRFQRPHLLRKEFSIPLPATFGARRVQVELSVPAVEAPDGPVHFAEHRFDAVRGVATDEVVLAGQGGVLRSSDLGATWDWVGIEGFERTRFVNSFTLADGTGLLQTGGIRPNKVAKAQPDAGLVVAHRDGAVLAAERPPGRGQWHGTCSVAEHAGVVLYADYQRNPAIGDPYRTLDSHVLRSADGGRSWESVLCVATTRIRHFHTLVHDPVSSAWLLSSGDDGEEVAWWRSADAGTTWEELALPGPPVRARFRTTDVVLTPDAVIWGADDYLGSQRRIADRDVYAKRVGARLFAAQRDRLDAPADIGYAQLPVRNLVDVGEGWLVLTQSGSLPQFGRPRVLLLGKHPPHPLVHLFDVDRYELARSGFTSSLASRAAKDGVFFSFRLAADAFAGGPSVLRWEVAFD